MPTQSFTADRSRQDTVRSFGRAPARSGCFAQSASRPENGRPLVRRLGVRLLLRRLLYLLWSGLSRTLHPKFVIKRADYPGTCKGHAEPRDAYRQLSKPDPLLCRSDNEARVHIIHR
jgi:hypothetical protein